MTGIVNEITTTVTLPEWIFEQAKDQEEIKRLALQYMERYPHLQLKKIIKSKCVAICVRR